MISIRFIIVMLLIFNSIWLSEPLIASERKKFKLSITLENDFVTIRNIEGCGFIHIGFRLTTNGKPIGFNEFGMFDLDRPKNQRNRKEYAQFSFSIKRNERGVLIEGIEGVEWVSLLLEYNTGDSSCLYQITESGFSIQ